MKDKTALSLTIEQVNEYAEQIIAEVEKAVIGKRKILQKYLAAFLSSGGQCLNRGLPGFGENTDCQFFCYGSRFAVPTYSIYARSYARRYHRGVHF